MFDGVWVKIEHDLNLILSKSYVCVAKLHELVSYHLDPSSLAKGFWSAPLLKKNGADQKPLASEDDLDLGFFVFTLVVSSHIFSIVSISTIHLVYHNVWQPQKYVANAIIYKTSLVYIAETNLLDHAAFLKNKLRTCISGNLFGFFFLFNTM